MAFSLEQASLAQRPLLAAMLSDCLRELGVDGDYPYLSLYWREAGRYPYLMLSDRQTAGFALVRRIDSATVEMAEFYIKPEWRRNGMGQRAAAPCSRSILAVGRCRSARIIRAGWRFGGR
ncbi:TPA: GNAT family N-acetyltransferase [Serratia marcescens]|uniref:GNAT family N-acetyltransferase n=1 Tax=Serratia marcescens TaxID=615 RepID=UPI003860616E